MDSLQWRKENPERWKAIAKRSYQKHRSKTLEYFKAYYQKNKDKFLARAAVYRDKNRAKIREESKAYYRKHAQETKEKVFAHYGPNGEMRCSWEGCEVRDVDMLSIDHLDGNGGKHRLETGKGFMFYRWLIRNKYPDSFQTLCMNHQVKKEALKRRT